MLFRQGNTTTEIPVTEEGQYKLIVRNRTTGCESESIINLQANKEKPISNINTVSDILNCNQSNILLDGYDASHDGISDIIYTWKYFDDVIVSSSTQSSIRVDQSGSYILEVTNQSTGCTSSPKAIFIDENKENPTAAIEYTNLKLSCKNDQLELNALDQPDVFVAYEWWFENSLLGTSPNLSLQNAGTYRLRVINRSNGCSAEDEVEITTDYEKPEVNITADFNTLNCNRNSIQLNTNVTNSSGNLSYEWRNEANILIENGANNQNPIIEEAGEYKLIVTNNSNGCISDEATINIIDVLPPSAEFILVDDVKCFDTSDGKIEVDIANGQGEVTLQWSNGASTRTLETWKRILMN